MSSVHDKIRMVLTEDGVYHVVCGLKRGFKAVCEGNLEIFELCSETL